MRPLLTTSACVCLVGLAPGLAAAHAHLLKADPPAGAIVRASPRVLRLTFSEPLVLPFSGVRLVDASGRAPAIGKTSLDARDKRVMVQPLAAPLAPGAYTVRWRAVSADTHRTQGSYGFRIAP